jgi:hypothetical protein
VSTMYGSYESGATLDIADVEAAAFVAAGLAEAVVAAPEAAMLEDAPERATLPRARPRGV